MLAPFLQPGAPSLNDNFIIGMFKLKRQLLTFSRNIKEQKSITNTT
jgi:hypothetical protein